MMFNEDNLGLVTIHADNTKNSVIRENIVALNISDRDVFRMDDDDYDDDYDDDDDDDYEDDDDDYDDDDDDDYDDGDDDF